MNFFEQLEKRALEIDSLLCVGLDPHPDDLPENTPQAAKEFCLNLVEQTKKYALTYKPNAAFFEAMGGEGYTALQEVIAAIPDEIPVLLDAKRGDIFSTAQAYAQAIFETLKAGAVTINPYLGRDAITPFIENPEHGIFLLCKTSNPGAADLQDQTLDNGLALFEQVAELAQSWNEHNNIGLVVGATHPEALRRVRTLAPDLWFLAPGVGAQGGDLKDALQAGLREDGLGMLVTVSRGIARADNPSEAAKELRDTINEERAKLKNEKSVHNSTLTTLASALLKAECVRFGEFILKSGLSSPIYIDLRRLAGHPEILKLVARAYLPILRKLKFDRIAALPYAAMPIGTAISLQGGWPMVYPRKEAKDYGTKASIEGEYQEGETVVIIDDLTTTGLSKFEGIEKMTEAGMKTKDVVVLIDRESGAKKALAEKGYNLHAVFSLTELIDLLLKDSKITPDQHQAVLAFIQESK